jgi:hypothetical protein
MVRAENNTIFGSVGAAKTAECAVCGHPLRFKEEKQEAGTFEQAKHCGKIYVIGQSGQATITMATDPEYKKREDEIVKKQSEAKKLRRQGKEEEAKKKEDEARDDAIKLNEEQEEADKSESQEPKTSEQPERERERPLEERRARRM